MASGRQAVSVSVGADYELPPQLQQQMCGESLTLLVPHCHCICPRTPQGWLSPLLCERGDFEAITELID